MMKIKGILGMLWMLFPLFAFAQEKVVPMEIWTNGLRGKSMSRALSEEIPSSFTKWDLRKSWKGMSHTSIREVRLGGLRM